MMIRSGNRRRLGYSLLELLVSIGLMSVVMTLGVRSFAMLTSLWNETSALADLSDGAVQAFKQIEVDLADTLSAELSGVSIVGIDRVAENKRDFNSAGDADDSLIIPVQGILPGVSLYRSRSVQYHVDRDNGRSHLKRSIGVLGDKNPSSNRTDVISRFDTLRFDVSFATGDAKEPWVDEWKSEALPRAVRVSLTLADPDNIFRQVSRKKIFSMHVR
ncbi:MAG: type II secretion system protein [Candidatus Hydrogenedentota bacterium]